MAIKVGQTTGGNAPPAGRPSSAVTRNSILKVKTQDESLRNSKHDSAAKKVRKSIGASMRNLFSVDENKENSKPISRSDHGGGDRRSRFASSRSGDEDSTKPKSAMASFRHSLGSSSRSFRASFRQSRLSMNANSMKSLRNLFSGSSKRSPGMQELDLEESNSSHIKFDSILIREYKTQVDVNPGVSEGAALTMCWEFESRPPVQVDKYEESRPPRKKIKELKISPKERLKILQSSGVSRAELDRAVKETDIARRKRSDTIRQMSQSAWQEKMESLKRGFKRKVGLKKSDKQEEDELWKNAEAYFLKNC